MDSFKDIPDEALEDGFGCAEATLIEGDRLGLVDTEPYSGAYCEAARDLAVRIVKRINEEWTRRRVK